MLLYRFLSFFNRIQSVDDEHSSAETRVKFALNGDEPETMAITSISFDVEKNEWVISLRKE